MYVVWFVGVVGWGWSAIHYPDEKVTLYIIECFTNHNLIIYTGYKNDFDF